MAGNYLRAILSLVGQVPATQQAEDKPSRPFVVEGWHTEQYYRWVTKAQWFPLKTVRKQGKWSEEFRRVIFTEQSPVPFERPRRLDNANPSADPQQ